MSHRTVGHYDWQLCLFPHVFHDGKRIDRIVQMMQDQFQTRRHPAAVDASLLCSAARDDKKAANESDMVNDGDAAPFRTLGSTRREGQIGE
jgi:hypothetical protein